eukprot:8729107-Lingulodinium_polyedra.AAC.1
MQSNQPSMRLANRTFAHFTRAPENWRARGVREHAISKPVRRRTATATTSLCSVLQTLHSDA